MDTQITTPKSESKSLTLRQHLEGDAFRIAVANALPKHITPERFVRVALTALTKTPKLRDCTQESVFSCLLTCGQLGIEPDGRRAHLIPYGTSCTLIIDYKGLAELAMRSGLVSNIHADVVRQGDIFEYETGDVKKHVPHFLRQDANRPAASGDIYAVFAQVTMKDGTRKADVMSVLEIEDIRKRSRSGQSGPWKTDWNEMAKKTVFRRLSKWLPLSAEFRDAVSHDDEADEPKPISSMGLDEALNIQSEEIK